MSDFAANSTETAEAVFDRVEHSKIDLLGLKGFQTKWYARMRAEKRCRDHAAVVSERLAGSKESDEDKALQAFQRAANAMIESLPPELRQSAVYWLIGNVSARETAERVKNCGEWVENLNLAKRSADERLAQAEQQIKSIAKEMAAFVKARHAVQ